MVKRATGSRREKVQTVTAMWERRRKASRKRNTQAKQVTDAQKEKRIPPPRSGGNAYNCSQSATMIAFNGHPIERAPE